ncbi:hypothetical protein AB0H77_20370 [Streptomyces sp. NPDC050844]|uniref:hypothetical protein n=1 Tax=Streptomyces sp. NPDC050844 TaxID=3155790 RepID=UPI00340F938F
MASEVVVEFEAVDQLPGGRLVLPLEAPGNFTWQIVKDHMREQAQTEMRDQMQYLIAEGRWVQMWNSSSVGDQSADAHNRPVAERRAVTTEVRIVDELPDGKTVDMREVQGYFAWLVLKGNITEQARAEMQAQMQYLSDTGQWKQAWSGSESVSS